MHREFLPLLREVLCPGRSLGSRQYFHGRGRWYHLLFYRKLEMNMWHKNAHTRPLTRSKRPSWNTACKSVAELPSLSTPNAIRFCFLMDLTHPVTATGSPTCGDERICRMVGGSRKRLAVEICRPRLRKHVLEEEEKTEVILCDQSHQQSHHFLANTEHPLFSSI